MITVNKLIIFITYLTLGLTLTKAVNITVYTKNFAPFSFEKEGYSIDFVQEMVDYMYGASTTVSMNVVKLDNNTAIFNTILATTNTVDDFSLGTAGISITTEREKIIDFLPPFFESGFQVMVRSDNSFNTIMKEIVKNILTFLGLALLGIFALTITFAPMAWFFEMAFCPEDKLPIFDNVNSRKSTYPEICGYKLNFCNLRFLSMLKEFWHAVMWTGYTLAGVQTGYPMSFGAGLVHKCLKIIRTMIMVVAIGAVSAIITVSSDNQQINSYSDLGGRSVCTVSSSTSESYLEDNQLGFTIVRTNSIDKMFDAFWNEECDAVVYDFPALQAALKEKDGAVIVGPVFNKESYGIVVKPGHPVYEKLKQAVIQVKNDHAIIDELEDKWLGETSGVTGKESVSIPTALIVVPSVVWIGLAIAAFVWLWPRYEEKSVKYDKIREKWTDTDYEPELKEIVALENNNDTNLMGMDESMDRLVVPFIMRIQRLSYEQGLFARGKSSDDIDKIVKSAQIIPVSQEEDEKKEDNRVCKGCKECVMELPRV